MTKSLYGAALRDVKLPEEHSHGHGTRDDENAFVLEKLRFVKSRRYHRTIGKQYTMLILE